jgi:hypothetical protein
MKQVRYNPTVGEIRLQRSLISQIRHEEQINVSVLVVLKHQKRKKGIPYNTQKATSLLNTYADVTGYQPEIIFFSFCEKELQKCNYCIFAKVRIIAMFVTVALRISDV